MNRGAEGKEREEEKGLRPVGPFGARGRPGCPGLRPWAVELHPFGARLSAPKGPEGNRDWALGIRDWGLAIGGGGALTPCPSGAGRERLSCAVRRWLLRRGRSAGRN